jgi:surfeit locus 1 family protein
MILIATSFIALFVHLGFWQLARAEEKKALVSAYERQAKQAPIVWDHKKPYPEQYQKLKLQGIYLAHQFFLDNQHMQHKFGFHILSPLLMDDGTVVVIDRGWVPGDPTRRSLPSIQIPTGKHWLEGFVYYPSKNKWLQGPTVEERQPNATILEWIDIKKLSQVLQKRVYPFIIRLDKAGAYGFVREWTIVSMPAHRHLGYAVQWFALALVVFILFVALNLKKQGGETNA